MGLIGEAIGAGLINAATQAGNAYFTGRANKRSREFAREMYWRQREDALSDWRMQNEYNSPVSQMERLKAAGLNPNLVYGNGAEAMSSSAPRSSSASVPTMRPVEFDAGSVLGSIYDVQLKTAQIDNLKAQNAVAVQDAILRAAQVISTTAGTEKTKQDIEQSKFDLMMKNELKETSVEAARESLRKLQAETQSTLTRTETDIAMRSLNLQKGAEEILNYRSQRATSQVQRDEIRQQIINLKKDEQLKQLDIDLKKMGIQPGDPMWMRAISRVVNGNTIGTGVRQFIDAGREGVRNTLSGMGAKRAIDTLNKRIRMIFGGDN